MDKAIKKILFGSILGIIMFVGVVAIINFGILYKTNEKFKNKSFSQPVSETQNVPEEASNKEARQPWVLYPESWKIVNESQEESSNHSQISVSYPEIPSSTKKLPIFYRILYKFIPILDKFFGKIIKLFLD